MAKLCLAIKKIWEYRRSRNIFYTIIKQISTPRRKLRHKKYSKLRKLHLAPRKFSIVKIPHRPLHPLCSRKLPLIRSLFSLLPQLNPKKIKKNYRISLQHFPYLQRLQLLQLQLQIYQLPLLSQKSKALFRGIADGFEEFSCWTSCQTVEIRHKQYFLM